MGSTTKLIPYPEPTDLASGGAAAMQAIATDLDYTKVVAMDPVATTNATLPTAYPTGISSVHLSGANSAAGAWPTGGSGMVWTYKTNNDRAAQFFYRNNSASPQMFARVGATAWGPWGVQVGADTGWINCASIMSGFTGTTWQARQIGNQVKCRGKMANASFQASWTTIAKLPSGVSGPSSTVAPIYFPVAGATSADRCLAVLVDGSIQLWASTATPSSVDLSIIDYWTD